MALPPGNSSFVVDIVSSLTFSIQQAFFPSNASQMEICVMGLLLAAPCQCLTSGGNQTTSPGRTFLHRSVPLLHQSFAGGDYQRLPQRMAVPCGPCPGLNSTEEPDARAGTWAENRCSIRTAPVKHSAGPGADGCSPRWMRMCVRICSPSLFCPTGEHSGQYRIGGLRLIFTYAIGQHGDEIFHLRFVQSRVHGRIHMKLKLSAKAGDAGQRGNSRQFPALMAQIVTGKDVREKMFLPKKVSMTGAKSW